jgi:hypothetical protein
MAGKIEWFGGNQDGLHIYNMFEILLHTWDDIVDGDPVTEYQINEAFKIALVYLPSNRLYAQLQQQIMPMWLPIISAYETANSYERTRDEHGIEIGHTLRYMAGGIISYVVIACVGDAEARKVMPEVWKAIVAERFEDYKQEHLS